MDPRAQNSRWQEQELTYVVELADIWQRIPI
jgi:hypothetical protein